MVGKTKGELKSVRRKVSENQNQLLGYMIEVF